MSIADGHTLPIGIPAYFVAEELARGMLPAGILAPGGLLLEEYLGASGYPAPWGHVIEERHAGRLAWRFTPLRMLTATDPLRAPLKLAVADLIPQLQPTVVEALRGCLPGGLILVGCHPCARRHRHALFTLLLLDAQREGAVRRWLSESFLPDRLPPLLDRVQARLGALCASPATLRNMVSVKVRPFRARQSEDQPMSAKPAYAELTRVYLRLHRYNHLAAIVGWDRNAMMPPGGSQARAAAEAELNALIHRTRTDARLAAWLRAAQDEPLDEAERANLREMRRDWRQANALPESLVEAKTLAGARCEHAWRAQRPANDWAGFLENFRPVVRLARQEAQYLAQDAGLSPYDALMDRFEPGVRAADIDRLFGELKQWLPGLVARAQAKQRDEPVIAPAGPFPVARQRAMSLALMRLLGFDFDAGRLDESTHPFSGGVPEDVRLTTRYREDDFVQALMGTIHETGHARYEQNLPREWLGQPIGVARSYGIHESQSLSFEMQLARSRPFVGLLVPMLSEHFGSQAAFAPDNLHRVLTRVAPGLIRVAADELTYPAHVILRYEIERALIEGEIEAEDIPALWEQKMQALLGLDTRGNFKDGCMQDPHWTEGAFGYFPSYTLGAMYAAQWFAAMRRATPDLDARIAAGDLAPVFAWLKANLWSQASRWETPELVRRASGEALNPAFFRAHLHARYLGPDSAAL